MRSWNIKGIAGMLIITAALTSCGSVNKTDSRSDAWSKDIKELKRELPRKHYKLFAGISEDEYNKRLDDLNEKVKDLSDEEIKVELSKIIASVGDGHTNLVFNSSMVYPMQLYWFEEGMYVLNTTEDYKVALNTKVISINGKKFSEVADKIKDVISHENDAQLKKSTGSYMIMPEVLKGLKISDSDEIRMGFQDSRGGTLELKVKPEDSSKLKFIATAKADEIPLYRRNSNQNYWYQYLENDKTLFFKYNSCREMKEKSFKDFNAEMFKLIDEKKPEKLVIDLRNNGGGSSPIFDPFLQELGKREYLNDSKKLFVVLGRQTFSSAILNACDLKNKTRATFVGEPTGGKPNHFGEVKSMTLPESKITVSYSTKYFKEFKEDPDTMNPDIIINPTFKYFIDNRDGVLDYILSVK